MPITAGYQRDLAHHFSDRVPPTGSPDYFRALAERHAGVRPVMATPRAKDYLAALPLYEYEDGLLEVRTDGLDTTTAR